MEFFIFQNLLVDGKTLLSKVFKMEYFQDSTRYQDQNMDPLNVIKSEEIKNENFLEETRDEILPNLENFSNNPLENKIDLGIFNLVKNDEPKKHSRNT